MNNAHVKGSSMKESYLDSDVVLIEKMNLEIERFDVVAISAEKDGVKGDIIKRVIGLPNETVLIKDGLVYINGKLLKGDIPIDIKYGGLADQPFLLGNDEYFVMGDNRNESEDSRYEWLGAVKKNKILGKPFLRIFPFQRIGEVN